MSDRRANLAPVVALLAAGCLPAHRAHAFQAGPDVPPPDAEEVGIVERLGERVPLELAFRDEQGRSVQLADYFDGTRPVLLTLVYYTCPALCNALLSGLTYTLVDLEWTAGEQFQIVTVSIDPSETPELAAGKRRSYLEEYGRDAADHGWHFLVGDQAQITALAEAVGFRYRYEERTGLYTHAASVMVATPDGRLSRYLNDVIFEPKTLRLALAEASQGRVGTPVERLMLKWCWTYDPGQGRYVLAARKVMTIGGALVVLLTFAGLGFLWRRELRRHHDGRSSNGGTPT